MCRNSVLSELTPTQKTQLEMILKEEKVEKGQVLWRVGDTAEFAFIIKKGSFEFFDCPEQDLDEFDSGAFIGETRAMIDRTPCTTSIKATRKGIIFKIVKLELLSFLTKNPGLQIYF